MKPVKFKQIAATDGLVYALSSNGEVWRCDYAGWLKIENPKE